MNRIILFLLFQLSFYLCFSQAFQWAVRGGGSGSSSTSDMGMAVTSDSQGNVIMTGIFESTAQFGTASLTSAGSIDIYIAKYTKEGSFLWAVKAGGPQLDWVKAICTDKNDNILITGQFSGTATFGTSTTITANGTDIFVAKYNSNGVLQWAKKEGGASVNRGLAIACDTAGNVIVAGDFSGTATLGSTNLTSAGAADAFVMKYNSAGTAQWAKKGGSIVNDRIMAVATDVSGNIYVTGSFGGTATFGTIQLTATGGSNDTDIFTAKYDASGNVVWAKKGGSNSAVVEEGRGIAVDNNQNVYITGLMGGTAAFDSQNITSNGNSDAFLVKYNSSGAAQWAMNGGGPNDDEGASVCVMANGYVTVSGFYKGTASFGSFALSAFGGSTDFDAFISNYNSNGQILWAKSAGRTGDDKATDICSANDNNLYITGLFRNNILFDNIQLNAQGYSDAFLAQINDFIKIDTLGSHIFCAGDIIPVHFSSSTAFNSNNIFTVWLSDATGNFTNQTDIGNLNAISSDTVWVALPYNLPSGNNYRIRIEASDFPALSPIYHQGITVNAAPDKPLATSQTDFCYGDTLYTLEVSGDTVYWYADSTLSNVIFMGNILTVNEILFSDTTFYCVSENSAGCFSELSDIVIHVHPIPILTNNLSDTTEICSNGAPFTMDIIPAGGQYAGNGIVSGADAFHPAIATSGFHEITYSFSDSNNCTNTYNLYFDVLTAPVVSIDTTAVVDIQYFDTLFLSGTPQGGTFSGTGVTNNYFIGTTSMPSPCQVLYVYEDLNGCSDTASIEVHLYINDINENNTCDLFYIYPNPFSDIITIKKLDCFYKDIIINIFDIKGNLIKNIKNVKTQETIIHTLDLNPGIYYIQVLDKISIYNKLIIKL